MLTYCPLEMSIRSQGVLQLKSAMQRVTLSEVFENIIANKKGLFDSIIQLNDKYDKKQFPQTV